MSFGPARRRSRQVSERPGRRVATVYSRPVPGSHFWVFGNFQTAQNPFNAANTHVTSSDIAFWDDLAYVGDYGGFRIFDISRPKPKLVSDERCYGPQGDPSVFDTNRDGEADTLVLSVDSVLAEPECGAAPVGKNVSDGQGGLRYPDGLPGGPRVFEPGNMYFFETDSGDLMSEYRTERTTNDTTSPTTGKYCSSHLGIPVPAKDRYLLVNAYYRSGSSVIDFSDPSHPKEIAFADLDGTNTWSAYTYPRKSGRRNSIPVYSNDGLSRNYGTAAAPRYPEAAYGFQRFEADIGRAKLVGFDRLNPQLQERVIKTKIDRPRSDRDDDDDDDDARAASAFGVPAPKGAKNRSARHWTK